MIQRHKLLGSAASFLFVTLLAPVGQPSRSACQFPSTVRSWGAVESAGAFSQSGSDPQSGDRAAARKDGEIVLLYEEHLYRLDDEGRQHRVARRVYRYLTEKGVDDWSCTEADWSPWCEEKPIFRVRVITPDGQAHDLDQESIGEAPAEQDSPTLFSDDKLLRAPLPAIVVGAVVEEQIESREGPFAL